MIPRLSTKFCLDHILSCDGNCKVPSQLQKDQHMCVCVCSNLLSKDKGTRLLHHTLVSSLLPASVQYNVTCLGFRSENFYNLKITNSQHLFPRFKYWSTVLSIFQLSLKSLNTIFVTSHKNIQLRSRTS